MVSAETISPFAFDRLTPQVTALLQMVDTLPVVALAHLFPDQPCHHALYPLLADHSILCGLKSLVVVVVDAVKGRWDGRFLSLEKS